MPDIILLDLDLPGMDGRDVLAEIVKDDALKHLAVVVLTSRDEHAEILRMYQLRCNSYICKPDDFDKYVDMIKSSRTTGCRWSCCDQESPQQLSPDGGYTRAGRTGSAPDGQTQLVDQFASLDQTWILSSGKIVRVAASVALAVERCERLFANPARLRPRLFSPRVPEKRCH